MHQPVLCSWGVNTCIAVTLDPRYNAVIGQHCPHCVITRTALYWNKQQKTMVSLSCHIIDPLILYEWLLVVHGVLLVLSIRISDFSSNSSSSVYCTEAWPCSV